MFVNKIRHIALLRQIRPPLIRTDVLYGFHLSMSNSKNHIRHTCTRRRPFLNIWQWPNTSAWENTAADERLFEKSDEKCIQCVFFLLKIFELINPIVRSFVFIRSRLVYIFFGSFCQRPKIMYVRYSASLSQDIFLVHSSCPTFGIHFTDSAISFVVFVSFESQN